MVGCQILFPSKCHLRRGDEHDVSYVCSPNADHRFQPSHIFGVIVRWTACIEYTDWFIMCSGKELVQGHC